MTLRERKKQQTREGLAAAAVDLFIERGYDATTIEDIAAAVDVSPRTFFRYYPTKEDVIVDLLRAGVVDLVERAAARPASEPLATSLREAARGWADLTPEAATRLLMLSRVLQASPCLQPRFDRQRRVGLDDLEQLVADRLGVERGVDPRPALVVALVSAVLSTAIERWSSSGGSLDLVALVDEGFGFLEFGIQSGVTSSSMVGQGVA
jgi:AcrR family transcriptional regulator